MQSSIFSDKTALIVDDNPGFLRLLCLLLTEIGLDHIYQATSTQEGLELFLNQDIDLCILDIDLGDTTYNGIDLAEKIRIRDTQIPIIFITSHFTEAYYHKCRHTLPSSFMNKELSRFKLVQAVDLALLHTSINPSPTPDKTETPSPPLISEHSYFFKIGDSFKAFELEEIAFFFAKDKLTFARVKNRNYPTNVHLKTLEEELHPNFLRIHKSYLVNRERIKMIKTKEGKVQIGQELLPIGYAYRKNFFNNLRMFK